MPPQRVCVIGGGPAGLAAALEGARLGLQVDLLERNWIGANIRCAEGFFDSLRLAGKPQAGVRFKVQETLLKVQREYKVDCREIPLWMIDRSEWQRSLAVQIREAGARILENTRVTVDLLKDLQREYDWIIDSSGVPSITSLYYGFRDYYRRYGAVTAQYVVEGDFSKLGDRLKFVLFPHYAGYYWIFPKGRDCTGRETANIGIGFFPSGGGKEKRGGVLWEELNKFLVKEGIQGKIIRQVGGLAPVRLMEKLRYGNILLVGDAAGCASPLHGGGIDTAYMTGQLAVRWIVSGRDTDFTGAVHHLLRRKLEVEERLCRLWERLDADTLDRIAGLIARDYGAIGIRWFATHLPLLLGNLRTGFRFRSGLFRGIW